MPSIKILASGQSSVAEMEWFLVGIGHKEVFLIICKYKSGSIKESWHVLRYKPGINWNTEKEIFGQTNELLIEACLKQSDTSNLNWADDTSASKFYWEYLNKAQNQYAQNT